MTSTTSTAAPLQASSESGLPVLAVVIAMLLAAVTFVAVPTASAVAETDPSRFVPVRPCRLLDTRESPGRAFAAAKSSDVQVAGRCGINDGAVAAALTLTAIGRGDSGYATMYPTGHARPVASTLNYGRADTIANVQFVQLGAQGRVSVFTLRTAHFVIDVTGFFEPAEGGSSRAGRFVPIGTYRALDTRDTGRPSRRSTVRVQPNVPPTAIAVAVTIATTETRSAGYLAAFAAGDRKPVASVLNADAPGQTRSASAIVPVSSAGFDVFTQSGDHVIVDVTGYFTGPEADLSTDGLFVATTPTRLIDTRLVGVSPHAPRLWDRGTREFDVTAVTGGPVAAVAANFTVTNTEDEGYATAYPARTRRPLASTVNYDSGASTVATSSIVQTSSTGIAVYALEATHLIIDISGWFTGAPVAGTAPAPRNRPPADRRVVIISDSAVAGIRWNGALGGLRGFVASTHLESCRRLVQASCRGREGYSPPTVVEEIVALPRAGREDILVVATGYNDWHSRFSSDFDLVVAVARIKGYHHIAWIDYRSQVGYTLPGSDGTRSNYGEMNRILEAKIAGGAFPEVRRWRLDQYTATSVGWFYPDGVHQTRLGSWAVADWISRHVRAFDDRQCVLPIRPGQARQSPCPNPDLLPFSDGLPDIAGLYGL